jgi:hypothetical protein
MATVSTSSTHAYISLVDEGKAFSEINFSMTFGYSILGSSRKVMREDGIQSRPRRQALHLEVDIWAFP